MNENNNRYPPIYTLMGTGLSIATAVITLTYLGWTFDDPENIYPKDWKRVWVIFFAWLNAAFIILLFLFGLRIVAFQGHSGYFGAFVLIYPILMVLPILNSYFILSYVGTRIDVDEPIDPKDWKRKWMVFFSWLILVGGSLSILLFLTGLGIFVQQFSRTSRVSRFSR